MPRYADHPIEPLILNRWSPRAMSGAALTPAELLPLFEAARWAPSGGNGQPWRFVYAFRGDAAFAQFLDLLEPGNRVWCERAGALVVIVARTRRPNGKPIGTYAFDTGAAWMALALQGSAAGLVVHGMAGFDHARAATLVGATDGYAVQAMIAIGHPGKVADLPPALQEREVPSGREPVTAFAFAGRLPGTPAAAP